MMKDFTEKACYLDLPEGMDEKSREKYTQEFVKAPSSLHPRETKYVRENFEGEEAMRISMGC